jgi:tetratricopeptide (TPR) repeat protein
MQHIVDSIQRKAKKVKNGELGLCKKLVYYLLSTIYCLFLFGCALPRIVVLDDPLTPEEHLNLGVSYEKKGELDNALKEYETAAKKLPVAYLYIGNIYYLKGEFDKAEPYYRKAIRKDPKNADAYNNLAWLYCLERKDLAEAEKLASKAVELNPGKEIYGDTLEQIRKLKSNIK